MSGRPQGSAPRSEYLRVRLTAAGLAALDEDRGSVSRSAYVRRLLAAAHARKGT